MKHKKIESKFIAIQLNKLVGRATNRIKSKEIAQVTMIEFINYNQKY